MLSKTLSLNKGLFQHFFFNNLIFMAINIICTFFLLPFGYILMTYSGESHLYGADNHLLGFDSAVLSTFFVGTLFYGVLSGLGMTYFLKNEKASDFMHSLPFKRNQILAHMLAAFTATVAMNLMINGIILGLFSLHFKDITAGKIFDWVILTLIISLFAFIFTLFVGQLINHYFGHLVLTGLLLMLPVIFHSLATGIYNNLFRGATVLDFDPGQEKVYTLSENLTFPIGMVNHIVDHIDWLYFGIAMIVACILLAATYFLYERRRNERIVHSFQRSWLEWSFITLVVLLGVMVAGTIFTSGIQNLFVIAVIYILSFLIIYLLAQAVNQRSPRVRLNFRSMGLTFLVVALILATTYAFGKWQEGYVPDTDKVASVNMETEMAEEGRPHLESYVKDPAYIKEVVAMHHDIINHNANDSYGSFSVTYKMKDGTLQHRSYTDLSEEQFKKASRLTDDKTYSKAITEGYDWDDLKRYSVNIQYGEDDIRTIEPEDNSKFLKAFKADMAEANTEYSPVRISSSPVYVTLEQLDGSFVDFNISPYHPHLIQYMIDEKMIKQPSDIFNADEYYRLNVKPDHFKGQTIFEKRELKKLKKTKVSEKAFNQAMNDGSADVDGNYIYAIGSDDIFAIINMNKEVK
ncbi:OST3/OST6 family protein [Macrococcus brunensis]|uniref:OST3/OST6 family protein n=1 Tax=Macrococcus brunensis TaxID=198483 RepID=UPI001EEF88E4|nr:OST3/OST6 family protein [Macrococcus brunensis]ULG74700.1 OST3/OST6 family protein [Macrococcus brunensis]